ncbi:PHD finger protein 3 isoform X2 [Anolis carolinensis]
MDEGVKETAHSTIDEDDLSSNRKLRDQMDVTTVKSPRKSPRLMTQEPVRSLRQSTLAKRSNASPSLTAKKSAVKSGSAQKGGVKQQDKEQAKHESGNLEEHPEEMEHNSNRSCHKESVPSPLPDSVKSCKDSDELKTDTKREIPSQTKLEDTSHEVENVSHLPGTTSPTKEIESKTDVLVKRKHHSVGEGVAVCASAETNTVQDSKTDEEDKHGTAVNPFISELSSQEQTDYKTEKELCEIKMGDKCKRTRMTNENAGGIQEMFAVQSGYEDRKSKCSSDFQASGNVAHETGLPEEDRQESFEDAGKVYFKDNLPLVRRKLDQTFSKVVGGNSAKSETRNILEHSTAEDIPPQVKHEETDNIKMKEHETVELQGDGSSNISSKGTKNVKTKHTKSKQNKTTSIQQKSVSLHQDLPSKRPVLPHVHSQSVVSLKRHAEEQEKHQHKPAKVKKKHVKKEEKAQNFDSGASLKKKAHVLGKNFRRVQVPGQGQKISAERIVDKFSHHTGSKETPHLASGPLHPRQGQLLHLDQKLLQKHQLSKADNCIKEEGGKKDSIGTPVDPLKEDEKEKLKLRKLEKNLQPRQRRSSKSISVDEPPLFIPDNISTVKKESPDHLYATESKGPWVPSKQCGFCRKPHGNRFMVGCGRCDDWFHGDCVGLSLFQAQQMGEEDKEYVCVKCCAEEDQKADSVDENMPNAPVKLETTKDSRTMEYEKAGISKQSSILPQNKAKHGEDSVKHKVKIFKRESSDGRPVTESREPEMRKGQQMPIKKIGQAVTLPRLSSEEKHEKTTKDSLNVACSSESATKTGVQEKQEAKKKRTEKGRTASNTHTPVSSATKPSVDQIRQSVRQSLKEILEKRLTDSTLKIPEERAAKVATKIEKELFSFFRDTDSKYKNKYRSLIFNLKDPKNKILFKRVLKGEVTPDHLIRMSPEELASKELAAWRKRENRHTIEMIEKEQREVERRPITKITHKGEIEIESEAPVKEQEVAMEIQEPPPVKIVEKIEETEKEQEIDGSAAPNTTSQHKNHLFDLNCKICIGRMAPPSNDLSGKNVKIAVGVARKPSDNEAENIADALSSATSMLTPELLEEDKDLPSATLTSSSSSRSETPGTVESETLFLARLNFIWKGFINMPSVAKFVIKAYPISGSFESLTEDLPDSIQVGGRISPQTVWEYVDKIKATGTKEICVIRFTPVTEEDQISYALLFAYFSSRKRYGVAANNMKQIKDLYIIPLGASDKIPHQLVPFDGPGIEVHRPNLLLGLIIRQKLKRQISAVITHAEENAEGLTPEKKSKSSKSEILHSEIVEKEEEEEEEDFFNSFTAVLHKQRLKPQVPNTEEATSSEPIVESIKHEPLKPLRFLPGVLVGWENQSTALELVSKPLPVDDILQSLLDTTGQMSEHIQPTGDQLATKDLPLSDKQAALKEEKVDCPLIITEAEETKGKNENSNESTDIISTSDTSMADVSCSSGSLTSLSLKGKPPDVSTEAFLANLASLSQNKETKETVQSGLKLGDADRVSLETKRTTDFPVTTGVGKGIGSNAMASVDNVAISSKSPPFINLKRDPRQAAVRGQQNSGSENDSDSLRNEEIQNSQELDILGTEPTKIDSKILSGNDLAADQSSSQAASTVDSACSSQLEGTNQLHEEGLMQSIEKVHSVRGGLLPPPLSLSSSQIETENSCHSDFGTEMPSPLASGNFSPIRTPQPNFPLTKMTPPGFQFQGAVPPNFPPQNHPMFGFPPHLPPPLLPPPGYGFAPNALMPWPPVLHMSGQPPHFMGPIPPAPPLAHKLPRLTGPEHFYQDRDTRRPERRHSDPWSRSVPHADRAFSRRKSDQHRQRFYNESHSLRKGRHDWEPDSERNRHRDRSQDKDRERKNRDDGHREKERSRLSYSDKDSESKSSKEGRNPEKKEIPKSEERAHEREKEREKSKERHRERESEKSRERHHKDRDHSDRGKSKR